MISSESYAPAFVNNGLLEKTIHIREMLSRCLKLAVTKVQNAVTKKNDGEPLTQDCPEVWKLCECLDKALLHGLKQLQYGYWPFICEFTHPNCRLQLEGLVHVRSSLGRGRSWLCQALNDSSLESYFTSFTKNPTILGKYYNRDALLRDIQEMQVALTLMAGLEFVSFNIPVDVALLDSQGFSLMSANNPEPDTLSITLGGSDSKSNSSMTASVQSSADDEPEQMSIETAVELATDTSIDDCFSSTTNTNLTQNSGSTQKQDRVNRLINLVTDHDNVSMDVVHTRVLRRRKKTLTSISYACDNSGSSSSLDSEAAKFCDKSCDQNRNDEQNSENVLGKKVSEVKVKVSQAGEEQNSDDGFDWLGERGTPEGQEDPRNIVAVDSPACKSDVTAMSVEEMSIYDSQMLKENKVLEWNASLDCSDELTQWTYQKSVDSTETLTSSVATQDDLIEELIQDNSCLDGSLRVDANVALYLALEIFQQEEEVIYKAFLASTKRWNSELQPVFVVITDQSLYILSQGNENQGKLLLKVVFSFKDIDKVKVNLNYHSFIIEGSHKTDIYEIYTGSSFMTRSILSNLEVSIRRSSVKVLPSVEKWPEPELKLIQQLASSQLCKSSGEVDLQYFACVSWENYMGLSPVSTPGGPTKEGFLMFRRKCKDEITWGPAYFHLKAGVLYCFKDQDSSTPIFYVQLHYPHFNGCRRLQGTSYRPHSFELRLQGREKLMLAAPNDYEASSWQQAIMQMVALFGHLSDVEVGKLITCNLIVADHHFFIVNEQRESRNYFIQASAALADLSAVCVDQDCPSSFVLEFESGEANSCGGEWIILFADLEEKEKGIEVINALWQDLFQLPLNVSGFKDLSIWSRCLEHCQKQTSLKEQLTSLFASSS